MDEIVRAHQIPDNPIPILVRNMARGIRAPVRVMLITLQSVVFPRPESAPTVMSSTHIKISLKPRMTRYSAEIWMASASWKNRREIGVGRKINAALISAPHITRIRREIE